MTPLSDSDSDLGRVIIYRSLFFSQMLASFCVRSRSERAARLLKHGGARACLRGWGQMFVEERPPPKKIYTPDGKYEFVEDGALGTGACGVVRIAKHLETGELYAIKIMSVTGRLSEFVKEMTAYGKVTGHPNVVSFHESQVDLDKKRVYLIMVCSSPAGPSLRCLPPSPGRLLSGVGVPCLAGAVPRRRALRPHRRVGQDGGGRRTPLLWPG
jgi:hypothetical protein